MRLVKFICLVSLVISACSATEFFQKVPKQLSIQEQIKSLHEKLNHERYNEEKHFRYFPPQFYEKKGLYSSKIHGNAMDKSNSYLFHLVREYIGCPDSNMFVTNFILSALLECAEYGTIHIDQDKFEESIDALLEFRDKNQQEGIPSYSFWLQTDKNGTWSANPINLQKVAGMMKIMPEWFKDIFNNIGLGFVATADQIVDGFHLPPDTDDSSINIALGIRIMNSPFIRQSIKDKWYKHNYDIEGYFNLLKKYSYRPFDSSNSSSNTLDIRTYYAFRDYLSSQNRSYNFSLFSTWLRSTDDQIIKKVQIPGNTNNFDCSVLNNTLFGLHQVLLNSNKTYVDKIFDSELQGLYLNSTSTIIYAIDSFIASSHPDIAFLYYPSVYDFYWFVARNVHLLNSYHTQIPHQLIQQAAEALNTSMKNQGTQFLLNNALVNEKGDIYWEEFLGVYNNKTYHEDAIFSTVMTLNALLDTWTVSFKDSNNNLKREFDPSTPQNVTSTLERGINSLLKKNHFSKSKQNAFFSGSFKSYTTLFYYPMNVHHLLNGTNFDPHDTELDILHQVTGVKGIIEESEYAELLKEQWFQNDVIEQFQGYNTPDFSYPYWSSPAITLSMGMSLLSKYQSIQNTQE